MLVRGNLSWVLLSLVAGLLLAGCSRPAIKATRPSTSTGQPASSGLAVSDEFVVGPGVTYANLTLFPITSRTPRDKDRLITLDEGLAAGTVEVRELAGGAQPFADAANEPRAQAQRRIAINPPARNDANDPPEETANRAEPTARQQSVEQDPLQIPEQSEDPFAGEQLALGNITLGGNQVNRVLVHNKSDKPLYLMPGEIILGGDQDRTIGQELVIAPSDKPVEVEVFCVEHGRWGGKGQAQTAAQLTVLAQDVHASAIDVDAAAIEADMGKFVVSAGALSKDARIAAQHAKDQGKVWDEVATANSKGGVKIQSGAFTGQYVEANAVKRLEPYLQKLTQPISEEAQVVGVVVAIDGKVESFDIFESTPLFRKLWPKLLKSYAVDAANAAESRDAKADTSKPCTQAMAATFVKDAISAEVTAEEKSGELSIAQRDSEKVLLFTAHDPTQKSLAAEVGELPPGAVGLSGRGAAAGGLGGSVHSFGAAK